MEVLKHTHLLLTALLLSACIPHTRTYPHIEAPNAEYGGEICGYGAPVTTIFKSNGVGYSINLEPGSYSGTELTFPRKIAPLR